MRPRPRYEAAAYRAAGKLESSVALISGGDSGIGRAVAVLFAREGADVAIIHLPEELEDARETAQVIQEEGRQSLLLAGDVRDPSFCQAAVEATVRQLGRLSILVNNAAYQHHVERLEELSDAQWQRTFETNIYGYMYLARAALPHMKRGSCIINTGSVTGLEGRDRKSVV